MNLFVPLTTLRRLSLLIRTLCWALLFFNLSGLISTAVFAAETETGSVRLVAYQQGDWKQLVIQNQGHAFIAHFWGLTCGPCLEELPAWGAFSMKNQAVPLVTIQVDQVPEKMIQQVLNDSGLSRAEHRMLVDAFDEYVRAEVDPKWMGELPFTLLVDSHGKVTRLRGKVNFERVQKWLASAGR